MIVHKHKQGSRDWLDARAGIPTSSQFHKILTPTGKPSAQATDYMHELIAERIMKRPLEQYVSWAMERGGQLESEAVASYEFDRDIDTQPVGLITDDRNRWGASPDRLVGEDGLLEVKCPTAGVHVGYLLMRPVDKRYYPQLQGQLWITEREWVDILSYHPEMPRALVRVERDEKYLQLLAGAVRTFSAELEEKWDKLRTELRISEAPDESYREDLELQLSDALVGQPQPVAQAVEGGEDLFGP